MESRVESLVEERKERIVSPIGGYPTERTAHFIKPIWKPSIDLPDASLNIFSNSSLRPKFEPHKWPLKVEFLSWRNRPLGEWTNWVRSMCYVHQSVWRKAGIYEAVLCSTYQINRCNEMIYGFAEKWCSETNTFIFPWGEATITLEDLMVLSGYSVSGESVFCSLESRDLKEIEAELNEVRKELGRSRAKKAALSLWMKKFKDSGNQLEHEGFLAFWLCKYVFAKTVIVESTLPLAILLARGSRIALGPAVLSTIYRDLGFLKAKISSLRGLNDHGYDNDDSEDGVLELTIRSQFQLVQVWAYERFTKLGSKPNMISHGDPRLARWDNVNPSKVEIENVRVVLDSAKADFIWRPYTVLVDNWPLPKYYPKEGKWKITGQCSDDEELLSFAICLRVTDLHGPEGIVEKYHPHRVSMQFGLDQDVPGCVLDYNKPLICNLRLYIPARLSEGSVSKKYLEWWENSVSKGLKESSEGIWAQRQKKGGNDSSGSSFFPFMNSKISAKKMAKGVNEISHYSFSKVKKRAHIQKRSKISPQCSNESEGVPSVEMEVEGGVSGDNLTNLEMLRDDKNKPTSSVNNGNTKEPKSLILVKNEAKIEARRLLGEMMRAINDKGEGTSNTSDKPWLEIEQSCKRIEKILPFIKSLKNQSYFRKNDGTVHLLKTLEKDYYKKNDRTGEF